MLCFLDLPPGRRLFFQQVGQPDQQQADCDDQKDHGEHIAIREGLARTGHIYAKPAAARRAIRYDRPHDEKDTEIFSRKKSLALRRQLDMPKDLRPVRPHRAQKADLICICGPQPIQ